MKLIHLFEDDSADALQRKINGLQAMIDAPSTTQGEKDNAASALNTIKQKLKRLYPDYKPSTAKPAVDNSPRWNDAHEDWFSQMAKSMGMAYAKEAEDIKRYGKPMNVSAMLRGKGLDDKSYTWTEKEVLPFVKDLREFGSRAKRSHTAGNVETAHRHKRYFDDAHALIKKWCPELYAKESAARDKAYAAEMARSEKKRKEKIAAHKAATAASGITCKTAFNDNKELLRQLNNVMAGKMMGSVSRRYFKNGWDKKFMFTNRFFYNLQSAQLASIRAALNELDKDTRKKLYNLISGLATTGYPELTEAQKNFVLGAFKGLV
jgi:hypothetical protein